MSVSQLFGQSGYSGLWEPLTEFLVSWIYFLPSPPPFGNSSSFLIMRNQKNKLERLHIFWNCTDYTPLCPCSRSIIGLFARLLWIIHFVSFWWLVLPFEPSPQKMRDLFLYQIYTPPTSLPKGLWVVYDQTHHEKFIFCFEKVFALFVFCFSFWSVVFFLLMSHVNQLFSLFHFYHPFP